MLFHGVYEGHDHLLIGKHALLKFVPENPDIVLAQFDDTTTGLGHDWHAFACSEFDIRASCDQKTELAHAD